LSSNEFLYYFNSILTKGKKDNTYKFALARFLIEYAYGLDDSYIKTLIEKNEKVVVPYSIISKEFLKYYWHQICKYKIRQNYNTEKLPLIVQIIHSVFGTQYIPDLFREMNTDMISSAEIQITKKCFSEVVPRFQNIIEGNHIITKKIFYDYYDCNLAIEPQALLFFKDNYVFLFKAVILEWAKFLEKINYGLPRLISKIEREEVQRKSLEKVKSTFRNFFDRCFYCGKLLPLEKELIHVDHFIPWSYVFEDEFWNLVLACRHCNLMKHASLPPKRFIELLCIRNQQYSLDIQELLKSIQRLEIDGNPLKAITRHYQNCMEYGFSQANF